MRTRDDAARRAAWIELWRILLSEPCGKNTHAGETVWGPERRRGDAEVRREQHPA